MFVVRHADSGENRTQRQTRADHGSRAGHGPESQGLSTAPCRSPAVSDEANPTRKVPALRHAEYTLGRYIWSFNPTRKVPALRHYESLLGMAGSYSFNPTRKVPALRPAALFALLGYKAVSIRLGKFLLCDSCGGRDARDFQVSIRLGKFLLCDSCGGRDARDFQVSIRLGKFLLCDDEMLAEYTKVLRFQSDSESSCSATVPPILGGLSCGFARSFQNLLTGAVDKLIQKIDRLRLRRSRGYRSLPEPPRFVGVSEVLDVDQGLIA